MTSGRHASTANTFEGSVLDLHHTPLVQKRGYDLQSDGVKEPDEITSEGVFYGNSAGGGSAHAKKGINSFGNSMKSNFGTSG